MKPLRRSLRPAAAAAALTGLCCLPPSVHAQLQSPPALIDYQGLLTDLNGNPLGGVNGANYTVEFRIYENENGGDAVWGEKQTFTVRNGEFSVRLGEGIAIGGVANGSLLNAFDGNTRFLGVTVSGQGGEILPRLAFLTTPYSVVAQKALTASALAQTAGTTTTTGLTVSGAARINGNNTLELGAGIFGKQQDAGKIGYNAFGSGALDIVGAGTQPQGTDRKVYIYAEGGATVRGNLTVTSGQFIGNGAGLTNLNAGNLASGTIQAARLPSEVPRLNVAQTFTADQSMSGKLSFGATTRQMLNLYGDSYGIGVQDNTLYSRAGGGFALDLPGLLREPGLCTRARAGDSLGTSAAPTATRNTTRVPAERTS